MLRITRETTTSLDWVRSLAALAVVCGHARALFFQPFESVQHHNPVVSGLYFITGFGHTAVMLFFVLSGLLIGSAVVGSFRTGRFNAFRYALRRVTRLHIVLVPALLLTALWDHLGLLRGSDFYTGSPSDAIVSYQVADRTGLFTALGNSAYLQSIIVEPFGSNSPLWSLSYEFWYYMLFPALAAVVLAKGTFRLIALIISLATLWFIGPNLRLYFLIWLLGTAVAFAPRLKISEKVTFVIAIVGLTIAICGARAPGFGSTEQDFISASGLALMLYAILPVELPLSRLGRRLADMSYTLYLCHFPPLLFLATILVESRAERWQPDTPHLLAAGGILLVVVAYCWIISLATERQTERIRRLLDPRRTQERSP